MLHYKCRDYFSISKLLAEKYSLASHRGVQTRSAGCGSGTVAAARRSLPARRYFHSANG